MGVLLTAIYKAKDLPEDVDYFLQFYEVVKVHFAEFVRGFEKLDRETKEKVFWLLDCT